MKPLDDLNYLAAEAFHFEFLMNPHAKLRQTALEYTSARSHAEDMPVGEWVSSEQRQQALDTGRFIEANVFPNSSVTYATIWGTSLEDVVGRCARICRVDRERWMRSIGRAPTGPRGR